MIIIFPNEYKYVTVFEKLSDNSVRTYVPDLPGCSETAADEVRALIKICQSAMICLYKMEMTNTPAPVPTDISRIALKSNETAELTTFAMSKFRQAMASSH